MSVMKDIIDLSGNTDNIFNPTKLDNRNGFEKKLVVSPTSMALKSIGLSLIKMQYLENSIRPSAIEMAEENGLSNNDDMWQSAWLGDQKGACSYQFRHMLEHRLDKTYRCVTNRSRYCQNISKMTRANWIYHNRRGHVRINNLWRKLLKQSSNTNVGGVFEILCVICHKNKRPLSLSSTQFTEHMAKHHSKFSPYDEYFSYFKRCFICNDETKSFQQNLTHRQLCLAALLKDPNQDGTEHFNNCFKTQRNMATLSLDRSHSDRMDFDLKLKLFNNYKCTSLYLWLQLRRNDMERTPNGLKHIPSPINASLISLRQSISSNKIYKNCTLNISERIPPGSQINAEKLQRFMIPVPFFIKNEVQSKRICIKWRKSIKEEHCKIQLNAPLYCEICNAMVKNGRTAYCHIRMCHPSTEFAETTCKSCSKRFLTKQGFKNHFHGMSKCPVARRCAACNLSVSINDVYEHMFLKHKESLESLFQLQTCLICRNNVDDVERHLFDIHGMTNVLQAQPYVGKINYRNGTFFSCTKCSLTYFSEVELRNHMMMNDHYFQCIKCPSLKFYLSWELLHHMSVSHKTDSDGVNGRLTCDVCVQSKEREGCQEINVTFATSSEHVLHLIQNHLTPCTVLLDDIGQSVQKYV